MRPALAVVSAAVTILLHTDAAARDFIAESGVTGGLVVHLNCGDGSRSAALRPTASYAVHGLDKSGANVAAARRLLKSQGVYGDVSVDLYDGTHLPYLDNTVNLLVADDPGNVTGAEMLRVLVPGGAALTRASRITKPWPTNIDEWNHYLNGPDNNAVAADTVVGPPAHYQWRGDPKWTRHHDRMSSISAVVSSRGRIFYIMDEGSTMSIVLPSHWKLIARDAFNGKVLWKKPVGKWYSRMMGLKSGPADAPRRLVAHEDRVYLTTSLTGPVAAVDAATGETIREYPSTKGAEEILLLDGQLYVLCGPGSIGDGNRYTRPVEKRRIVAVDAGHSRKLWEHEDVVASGTMGLSSSALFYYNFSDKTAKALELTSGKVLWTSSKLPAPQKQTSFFTARLVYSDGIVLFAGGEFSGMTKSGGGEKRDDTLTAIDARTGRTRWTAKHPPSGYSSPENVFVIDGVVWCDSSSFGGSDGTVVGYDLKTGTVRHRFPSDKQLYWFHHRCYAGRATTKYIMTSRTGIEFIDLKKKQWDLNHWVRGACMYGIMPANGLVYTPPNPCACYAETMQHGFNALSATPSVAVERKIPDSRRLIKGPAYASSSAGTVGAENDSWPTYRCDYSRSGKANSRVSSHGRKRWSIDLGGRLTPITAFGGLVTVAAVDRHTLYALDKDSGTTRWEFTTGARIDSPPSHHNGNVIFGCNDGCVYSLRASDGALAWKFHAAPAYARMMCRQQLESLWPVHGSVLIENSTIHVVAGRSVFLDGGMYYYRLNASTGEVKSVTHLDDRNPRTGNDVQELVNWLNMAVGRPDILSTNGKRVWMRSQAFDMNGKRLAMGASEKAPLLARKQTGEDTHLFCPTGFLDDTSFHRTYWVYGQNYRSGWSAYYLAGKYAPSGKIMCLDDDLAYVFGRQPQYYRWTVPMEFRLFASNKTYKPGAARKAPPPKPRGRKKRWQPPPPGPVTNKANYKWSKQIPLVVRAMVLSGDSLYVAGARDVLNEPSAAKAPKQHMASIERQEAAFSGKADCFFVRVDKVSGNVGPESPLTAMPVFDGMAVAYGALYVVTTDGRLTCFKQ